MSKKTESAPHGRAREHLKKFAKTTAAFTLGTACTAWIPMGCDPAPQPLKCANSPKTGDFINYGQLGVEASWEQADAGRPQTVHVALVIHNGTDPITFNADPNLVGARISGINRTDFALSFSFTPDSGSVSQVQAVIEIDCATHPRGLKLGFDVTSPQAGASVTVTGID